MKKFVIMMFGIGFIQSALCCPRDNRPGAAGFYFQDNWEHFSISSLRGKPQKCDFLDYVIWDKEKNCITLTANKDNKQFTYYLYELSGRLVDACALELSEGKFVRIPTERITENKVLLVLRCREGLYYTLLSKDLRNKK